MRVQPIRPTAAVLWATRALAPLLRQAAPVKAELRLPAKVGREDEAGCLLPGRRATRETALGRALVVATEGAGQQDVREARARRSQMQKAPLAELSGPWHYRQTSGSASTGFVSPCSAQADNAQDQRHGNDGRARAAATTATRLGEAMSTRTTRQTCVGGAFSGCFTLCMRSRSTLAHLP